MFSEEPAPAPPTMNSWVNRSAGDLIGAVTQRTQTRAGSDVAPRLRVKKIGGGNARRRRHVLNDDRRLPGNMPGEVSREEAPGKIVVVADGVADDQSDLLVLVEILRRWARSLAPRRPMDAE